MKGAVLDIFRLFYPEVCAVCGDALPEGSEFICNTCRWEMPLTGFWKEEYNPAEKKFMGHIRVERASSFFFYVHESGSREMVHKFKYDGGWRIALNMGRWFGKELADSGRYDDIDVIIPLPLHFRRRLKRGYNQSEYLARGICESLSKPLDSKSVMRKKYSTSQTTRSKSERWDNVKDSFSVRRPEYLENKHLLLVDDVLTTGATIISCAEAILAAVPGSKISIVTLAVSRNEIF